MSPDSPPAPPQAGRFFNGWTVIAVLLALIIIIGCIFIWMSRDRGHGVEISLAPPSPSDGQIYVIGKVNNPGLYPLRAGDTIDDIIRAAGGASASTDLLRLEINIPETSPAPMPQRVDINRAEAWLLAALPGIGEGRAQAIVNFRRENGPFRDIYELLKVPGIGNTIFDGIKDLVTVRE